MKEDWYCTYHDEWHHKSRIPFKRAGKTEKICFIALAEIYEIERNTDEAMTAVYDVLDSLNTQDRR